MAIIDAVMTDTGRDQLAQHLIGDVTAVVMTYFKVGEGGFNEAGGIKTPKTPDETKTRIESDGTELTGELTFANGSNVVNGDAATQFLSEVLPGQYIRLDADLEWVEVASVI